MKRVLKWCLLVALCASLFTPALAWAQWGGGWGGYDEYYYEEYSWWDSYIFEPFYYVVDRFPVGGCNNRIEIDD